MNSAIDMSGRTRSILLLLMLAPGAAAQWDPPNPVKEAHAERNGMSVTTASGVLSIRICTPRIFHVRYTNGEQAPAPRTVLEAKTDWESTPYSFIPAADTITLSSRLLRAGVVRNTGLLFFADSTGREFFADCARSLTPVCVNGESTFRAEMFSNLWSSSEAFYGLGGHQAGVWNYRGESVDLSQDNTNISIPLLVSNAGYGILWNNTSRSRCNNRFPNALYFSSEVAEAVDYFVLYGPSMDSIIAGYRELTGRTPLYGKWAYGFWQCKNRYQTQAELLNIAGKYRQLQIPIDNIVQDWFWWKTMGEPVFDEQRYPDPAAMVRELHAQRFHFMISCWPFFRPGSTTYEEMDRKGFFVDKTKTGGFHPAGQALYDASNPEARKYYWQLIDSSLFRIGVDAWWLDTTEPETEGRETNILVTNTISVGNGARYVNAYPLYATMAIYEGQRSVTDRKRVFILSRSAFAGSQRTAAAVWSGDIRGDWLAFRRQIPSGLNYSLSGLPYWTTDIGGFIGGNPDDPLYRELFVRWFQFGAFTPIFRVHGTRTTDQNEVWSYGTEAQSILTHFLRLRYRLMPYIYSVAGKVTREHYTPMRALVMDFPADVRAANTADQFLFGPALLVSPVTEPSARTRRVYLPASAWYDFWTGQMIDGGQAREVDAPIERIPVHVRAGAIVPMGPEVRWAMEKPADPLEVRVYPGADGEFTLYEDEGDTYDYERGRYSSVRFRWDDRGQMLTIGSRAGSFPGMLQQRTMLIVFVRPGHGTGLDLTSRPDRVVSYSGNLLQIVR